MAVAAKKTVAKRRAAKPAPVAVVLELEKETPGTYKFKEIPVDDNTPVIIGAQYVKKSYFGDFKPSGITITIEAR